MGASYAIRTEGLSYHFSKDQKTLDNINITVEKGSVYGFLGPNGAGKTTTLSLLLGLLENQQGTIEVLGYPLQSHRMEILKRIGSLIETPSLYAHLTAKENLEVYRQIYGAPKTKITEVLNTVGLADTGKKTVKKFSLGMKQRLSIALALLPQPELLILDEPSNGLDPSGIIELRQLIKKLNQEHGMTILISSHLLSEVEKMVTHIGIINKGKVIFQGSLQELHAFQQRGSRLMINTSDNERALNVLQSYKPEKDESGISIPFQDLQQVSSVQKLLMREDLDVYLLQPKQNDLEQLFIDLTSVQS
jgi:lantibiotic transport system ATP-binding protein